MPTADELLQRCSGMKHGLHQRGGAVVPGARCCFCNPVQILLCIRLPRCPYLCYLTPGTIRGHLRCKCNEPFKFPLASCVNADMLCVQAWAAVLHLYDAAEAAHP